MKICVGIISYLPDGESIRFQRFKKLINLLSRIDKVFKLPILIIAQNWKDCEIPVLQNSLLIIYNYDKGLGITGARRALRDKFINSEFDYLIMLDDDSELIGDERDGMEYLSQIYSHPNMYGVFKSMLLKLFAISKEMYKKIDFPDGEAANGDFFEDMYLIMALEKLYPSKKFTFKRNGINEYSNSANDSLSTWYHKQFVKRKIGDNTREMIRKLKHVN